MHIVIGNITKFRDDNCLLLYIIDIAEQANQNFIQRLVSSHVSPFHFLLQKLLTDCTVF